MKTTNLKPYRPYIDNFDLTEEQKIELVNALEAMVEIILDEKFESYKKPINNG